MAKGLVRRLALVGVVVAIAQAMLAAPIGADHAWGKKHWPRRDNPFIVRLGDNVGGKSGRLLRRVADDWSRSRVLNSRVITGNSSSKRCRPTKGKVEVCSARYRKGWLGLATVWVKPDSGHIVQATVKLSTPRLRDGDARRHVLCQEIGHTLGLDHTRGVTCMNDDDGLFDRDYVDPNRHDYEQLERIYRDHEDGSAAVRTADEETSIDAELVPPSPDGGEEPPSMIVEDLGPGRLRITYIFWPPEVAAQP